MKHKWHRFFDNEEEETAEKEIKQPVTQKRIRGKDRKPRRRVTRKTKPLSVIFTFRITDEMYQKLKQIKESPSIFLRNHLYIFINQHKKLTENDPPTPED